MNLAIANRQSPIANGFTLIEVVISAALMALILVAAYLCLSACIKGKNIVEPRADIFQTARVAMAFVSADLRNACELSSDSPFLGMKRMVGEVEADNLDFATHNFTPRRAREGDFCEVSYYVEQGADGRFGLWRRRNPTFAPDPMSGGSKEEIAENILGVRFEYSDGVDWYDNWGEVEGKAKAENSQSEQNNLDGLPEAVRITLMLDSNPDSKINSETGKRNIEPPLVFQTVAYLNLADVENNSANSSANNSTDNSTQNSGDQSSQEMETGGGN